VAARRRLAQGGPWVAAGTWPAVARSGSRTARHLKTAGRSVLNYSFLCTTHIELPTERWTVDSDLNCALSNYDGSLYGVNLKVTFMHCINT
jgi:hypothetical protein